MTYLKPSKLSTQTPSPSTHPTMTTRNPSKPLPPASRLCCHHRPASLLLLRSLPASPRRPDLPFLLNYTIKALRIRFPVGRSFAFQLGGRRRCSGRATARHLLGPLKFWFGRPRHPQPCVFWFWDPTYYLSGELSLFC